MSRKPRPRRDRITENTYLEFGRPVRVLVRWGGQKCRNVLIERQDGTRVVRPFRGLRRLPQ
jgi:acetyl esterase